MPGLTGRCVPEGALHPHNPRAGHHHPGLRVVPVAPPRVAARHVREPTARFAVQPRVQEAHRRLPGSQARVVEEPDHAGDERRRGGCPARELRCAPDDDLVAVAPRESRRSQDVPLRRGPGPDLLGTRAVRGDVREPASAVVRRTARTPSSGPGSSRGRDTSGQRDPGTTPA